MLNIKTSFAILICLNILAFSGISIKSHEGISNRYFFYVVEVILTFSKEFKRI